MHQTRYLKILFIIVGFTLICNYSCRSQDNFDYVNFETEDGGSIEAALFPAESGKAVVFAHGAVFSKESWYFLAEKLQNLNIASLAIDFRGYGNSKAGETGKKSFDILGANDYLEREGYNEIYLVGGSMGGAAILEALPETNNLIKKVVLLAPAGGPSIKATELEKLFIVSIEEGLHPRVLRIYNESSKPKMFKEFAGRAHAQHMFKEDYAAELTKLILDFLN